jgi:nitroreductase
VHRRIPYTGLGYSEEQTRAGAAEFRRFIDSRRSVRDFSDRPVHPDVVADAIRAASSAPSGAHMQPWTFVAISDPSVKARIREAAEAEERDFYERRAPSEWLEALAPLGTDWRKPFLTTAPWLVVLFAQRWGVDEAGRRRKHYYVQESCGIAAGFFIAALHHAGLVTLTHTPSPMGFLRDILGRPPNEDPFILFPVGYPAAEAAVPDLARRRLEDVVVWFEP